MTAYQRLKDSGIGPKFLGHLTEGRDGRVVGFAVEWVQGARAAGPGDMEGCKKALERLHELGIKSGDINKHNFLVRDGHDVVLVDFETAEHSCSPQELEDEMSALQNSLEDTSFWGGVEIMASPS
jgi:predicted Ser/Thr protein kinase